LIGGGLLCVHLLLRDGSRIVEQTLEAFVVPLSVLQLGLITKQVGLCLFERQLEWTGVNNRQQVSLVNVLAFLEIDLGKLSIHATLDADRIGGSYAAQALEIYRDVAALGGGNCYRHHDLGGGASRAGFRSPAAGQLGGSYRDDRASQTRQQLLVRYFADLPSAGPTPACLALDAYAHSVAPPSGAHCALQGTKSAPILTQ